MCFSLEIAKGVDRDTKRKLGNHKEANVSVEIEINKNSGYGKRRRSTD